MKPGKKRVDGLRLLQPKCDLRLIGEMLLAPALAQAGKWMSQSFDAKSYRRHGGPVICPEKANVAQPDDGTLDHSAGFFPGTCFLIRDILCAHQDFMLAKIRPCAAVRRSLLLGPLILLGYVCLPSLGTAAAAPSVQENRTGTALHFPSAGKDIASHDRWSPAKAGFDPALAERVIRYVKENPYTARRSQPRWALWRHGHLVHVEGDFQQTTDVASLRKTWHAMMVGAAIKQGLIPSLDQKISVWLPELTGNDAGATWRHVLTQSAGFDYPYGEHPDYRPGEMWTYSDWNLVHLCNALARVYGKKGYADNYADVAARAYFDAIGLTGWSTKIVEDASFANRDDGVRFVISLEHMGRLGLLALARGTWNGVELVPQWFVEALETKQTRGMRVNYEGPNDGRIGLSPAKYPECPYGYLTWANTDGDLYPEADRAWACGRGAGGSVVVWNRRSRIVFAGFGIQVSGAKDNLPRMLDTLLVDAPPDRSPPASRLTWCSESITRTIPMLG